MATENVTVDNIRDVIEQQISDWNVPGLTIGILCDGEVQTGAFGIANANTGIATRPETLFQIGSISKIFTTTLIMTLVEEGKVTLDTPVITYIPDLPLGDKTARETITLRHLVTHMSGFYGDRFDDQGRGDDALARAVAAYGDLPQQTAPGELWTYCNAGFDLAGRVAEVVTGQGFEALMRARIFKPLGMARATYFPDEAILHAVAVGHLKSTTGEGVDVASPWPIPRRSGPAGAISTNVEELLRFARMHLQDGELDGTRIISADSARAMRSFEVDADAFRTWGLGWSRREVGGELLIEHNGATNGFTARLTTIPARGFALAILTNHNSGGAAHTKISETALSRWFGIEETSHEFLPDFDVKAHAGTYGHRLGDLTLIPDGDHFRVERINRNPFAGTESVGDPFVLRPIGDRYLLAEGGGFDGAFGEFILNTDGSIRFLRFGGRLAHPKV